MSRPDRSPHSPPKRLPVVVVTGFLGSGKTTLVNRLLAEGPRAAVLINEFGATPVDHKLLEQQNLPLMTLSGGCLCCQVRASLAPILKNIRLGWEQPKAPQFDRLILETSGVASPVAVIDCLARDPWLSRHYRLEAIIAVVAAPTAAEVISQHPVAAAQLAFADRILISQRDRVDSSDLKTLRDTLERQAPGTPIFGLDGLDTPIDDRRLTSYRGAHHGHSITQPDDHPFYSATLQLPSPLHWATLQSALRKWIQRWPALIRIKGIVHLDDRLVPVAVHAVMGHLFEPVPLTLDRQSDALSRLILISEGPLPSIASLLEDLQGTLPLQGPPLTH